MKLRYIYALPIFLSALFIFSSCTEGEQPADDVEAPNYDVPHTISADGTPEFDSDRLYTNDYSNLLHGIFMIAGNSRDSEYGHENYRPELFPDMMEERAERWLTLMHTMDRSFNSNGRFATHHAKDGFESSGSLDLSIYPHLVYSYHMHHRGSRFDDEMLYERLSREPGNFITSPGRYLLDEHYSNGRFYHDDGSADYESMSYGLGGLHGHGYAWIIWYKPGGEDNMGLLNEEMLAGFLGYTIEEMADVYRAVADRLDDAWVEEKSIYDFGGGTTWKLDAVGAMLRGKKAMYDFLYMFGDGEADDELARDIFDRTVAMVERVMPLAEPWGLPERIEFTEQGAVAGSDTVNLYDWYQFLNHIGGGFAFDRERESTSKFITRYREDLFDELNAFFDRSMVGAVDYHIGENGRLVGAVSFEDGSVMDDQLYVSTAGMFLTMAGNIYTNGSSFARADAWDDVDDSVAERSRHLYDLKFDHIELLEQAAGISE